MTSAVLPTPDRAWIPSHSPESDYFSHNPVPTLPEPDRDSCIPAGLPQSIVSPTAWTGADFENGEGRQRYSIALDDAQIREIEEACEKFKGPLIPKLRLNSASLFLMMSDCRVCCVQLLICCETELDLPLECISQESFLLPTLGNKLKALAAELTSGVGFFLIRGLDPQRYSNLTNVVLYLGISSYIGGKRGRQDELGNMLLHLTDLGAAAAPENERQAPYSNVGQPFHTDVGDIIGLYSLGEAHCGGESQLASTATVYNEIVKTRPDIIRLLSSPSWIFDRFGQWPPYTVRPILYPMEDENVLISFSRRPLVGSASSPRSHGIPSLSDSHLEAINALQAAAEQHTLSMKLQRGDLLFWNNLALLHSRRGFTDSPDCRRHLVRLWLRNHATERNWSIPEELLASWNDAFHHAGRQQLWPIEPIKDRDYICNQQRSSGHA